MPPLDPDALAALRAGRKAAADLEAAKNTSLPSESEVEEIDDDEELEAQMAELEQTKKLLLEEQKNAEKELAEQKKKNDKRQKLAKLRAEVDQLNQSIADSQDRLKALKLELAEEARSRSPSVEKTAPRVVRDRSKPREHVPFSSFTEPYREPEEARDVNQPGIDPSLAAYAQACAAAATGNVGANQRAAPGAQATPTVPAASDARSLLENNPLLAAACGLSRNAARAPATSGKSVPENFIIKVSKDKDKDKDRERVSYYDFIHGCFRLLLLRLTEDNKPVDDLIHYYEALTGFTTQYRWYAVYDLHQAITSEVEAGRREWADPIKFTLSYKFLTADTVLSNRSGSSNNEERKSRRDGYRPPRHDSQRREHREPRDHGREAARDHREHAPKRGPCNKYNTDPVGCPYGMSCSFRHICQDCYAKGIELAHPSMWCILNGNNSAGAKK